LSSQWCGHCKTLAPIYEKVGAHFASRDDVVIAKMDATANDVPDERFSVKGFPSLYLLTADKTVVAYSGERTEKEITAFVEEHAAAAKEAPKEAEAKAKADPAAELKDEL
jgi:protein disulfide-isomerase A1